VPPSPSARTDAITAEADREAAERASWYRYWYDPDWGRYYYPSYYDPRVYPYFGYAWSRGGNGWYAGTGIGF
jgi:hypothetical protein